jgi:hypothetical protein
MVAEIDGKGIDPIALPLRLRTRGLRFFDCFPTRLRLGSRRCDCEGVTEAIHRHAPIRHGASGVLLQDLFEFPAGNQEPVRMEHGDAAVELDLHSGIAGGGEGYLTELVVLLADCAAGERRTDQAGGK